MIKQITYRACAFAAVLGLTACGESSVQEVKVWMKETQQNTKPRVQPLSEPKKFTPFDYTGKAEIDPFNPNKLLVVLAKLQAKNSNGLKKDDTRRKEVLEGFPLDSIKMVGVIQQKGLTIALVQVDKSVFQVKIGNYLGQNDGIITNVTETQIDLKELVEDATGELTERNATLELQESKK
jgi:type IV pilus assembly protein PilP